MTGPGYGVLVAFLAYAGVLAWLRPIGRRRRVMVTAFVLADAAVLWWLSGADTVAEVALRDWMPVAQILFTYWLSGAFVGPPMPRAEAWLARWDRRLLTSRLPVRFPGAASVRHLRRWPGRMAYRPSRQ